MFPSKSIYISIYTLLLKIVWKLINKLRKEGICFGCVSFFAAKSFGGAVVNCLAIRRHVPAVLFQLSARSLLIYFIFLLTMQRTFPSDG